MLNNRYCARERRIEDITARGGTFVLKDVLQKGVYGDICEGTLHFGDQNSADIMVRLYPAGGAAVIGPLHKTKECSRDYVKLMNVFKDLDANDKVYHRHVTKRQIIQAVLNLVLVGFMFAVSYDILMINEVNWLQQVMSAVMKFVLFAIVTYASVLCRRW